MHGAGRDVDDDPPPGAGDAYAGVMGYHIFAAMPHLISPPFVSNDPCIMMGNLLLISMQQSRRMHADKLACKPGCSTNKLPDVSPYMRMSCRMSMASGVERDSCYHGAGFARRQAS